MEEKYKKFCRLDVMVLALVALLPLLFFYRVLWIETYTLLANWDASIQSYAWYSKIASAVQAGTLPFWDFNTDSGTSFLGEMQTGAFYPPNWLFALVFDPSQPGRFQFWAELYSVLHFSLCGCFSYLLAREFGFKSLVALFVSIVITFFGGLSERGNTQPNIFAGMVYVPGVLFFVMKSWNARIFSKRVFFAICGGGVLGVCVLAGHMYSYIHGAFLSFLILSLFAFYEGGCWKTQIKKVISIIAIVAVASLLTSAIQLTSSMEYFNRALKWYGPGYTAYPHVVPFDQFKIWAFESWDSIFTFRCSGNCSEGRTLYISFTAFLLALIGFGASSKARRVILPIVLIILGVSLAGDGVWGKFLYHFPVLNIVRIPSRILFAYPIFMALSAGVGLSFLFSKLNNRKLCLAFGIVVFLALFAELKGQLQNPAVAGIPRAASSINPEDYYGDPAGYWLKNKLQGSLFRWVAEPNELVPPNYGQFLGINGVRGHRSSMLANYFGMLTTGFDSPEGWFPRIGLKYLVAAPGVFSFPVVYSGQDKSVYELPEPLPLFHAVDSEGKRRKIDIVNIDWQTNSVKFSFPVSWANDSGEELFIGVTSYPGWTLTVNGEKRLLHGGGAVRGAFMSAVLKPGDKDFELSFFPRTLWVGLLSWVILLGALLFWGRRAFKDSGSLAH